MDKVSKAKRSEIMSKIRSRDTKMELAVRPVLEALGFTYHPEDGPKIPGAPDFAHLTKYVAIFLDSCLFHGCPEHCKMPKSNVEFWRAKIARNMERDREVMAKYEAMGWTVIRVWEHDLRGPVKEAEKARKREEMGEKQRKS